MEPEQKWNAKDMEMHIRHKELNLEHKMSSISKHTDKI